MPVFLTPDTLTRNTTPTSKTKCTVYKCTWFVCHACQYVCIWVHYLFFDRMHVIAPISYYTHSLLLGFSTQSRCVRLGVGECVRLPAPGSFVSPIISLACLLAVAWIWVGWNGWIWALMCLSPQLYTCQQLTYIVLLASWCHCYTSQSCSVLEQFACFFLWCNFIYSNVGTREASFSPSAPIRFCGQPFS